MCGFAGFIDFHSELEPDKASHYLKNMGLQLSRRGPDEQQFVDNSSSVHLVFNRLSIVDLIGGTQPIWNEDQNIFVAINGEIYNHLELRSQLRETHQFRTHSDAEIVLHLYEERGVNALELLNGMFAICIWDSHKQQLLLARDRLGIKPLYYTQVGSQLIFASTLFALLAHPHAPRTTQFQDLTNTSLTTSYVEGVYRLAGGHSLSWDATTKTVTPQSYWNLSDHLALNSASDSRLLQDYIAEYRELFEDSVRLRLMSDVPIGVSLSGGLDSGIVAAVANQIQPQLHCFSILADYTRENGDIVAARKLCEELQLPFHPVFFQPEKVLDDWEFSLDTFEYLIWLIDSPTIDLEWVFRHELYRYMKTVMPELKVVLLGQGSDEFAGGYSLSEDRPNSSWQDFNSKMTKSEKEAKEQKRKLSRIEGYLFDFDIPYPSNCQDFQRRMLEKIYALQRYNLWHEDRTSSSQSLEARIPFLDHRLVEFLAAIPPAYHADLFWNKTIIREMATAWLPRNFTHRAKSFSSQPCILRKFKYQIAHKIFPEFQTKYRDVELFPATKLSAWFEVSGYQHSERVQATTSLFNAMAMTIFAVLCFSQPNYFPEDYMYGNSPFTEKFDF
ncbi:MAG: asparagine synthase (glutamine-hydrolyzing) [Symploca sp. SIO2C1]|nr:asparagine synthase (glutamine-hydrolyzing) [Symploca sp. SIO2C1]